MQKSEKDRSNATAVDTERRAVLGSAAAVVGGLAVGTVARAQESSSGLQLQMQPFDQSHELKPLPFDASSLDGLSRQLIESHWSNNYGGSVRALNETNRRLADALTADDVPAFIYNDLKREHLMRTGSVVLHELYFDNLGGNGRPDADARMLLGSAFGSFDRWEREFRRVAAGLGGGSGWVILGYNRHFGTLENYWLADHMHGPATTEPLLVIDMYEHSYHMDYGAATAQYIDAFFNNVNWETLLSRVEAIA